MVEFGNQEEVVRAHRLHNKKRGDLIAGEH